MPIRPRSKPCQCGRPKERPRAHYCDECSYGEGSWKSEKRRFLYGARSRAKKRGLEFNLTDADIEFPALCPVLGIPIEIGKGTRGWSDNSPSLDRIDNDKGYVRGNVVIISWRANRLKSDATTAELRRIADFYD